METYNKDSKDDFKQEVNRRYYNNNGRVWGGMVLVVVGVLFLAHQAGAYIPHWLFSWEMWPIGIGLYIGARHSFRPGGWIIPVVVGAIFLANNIWYDFNLRPYFWPSLIIGAGLLMIFRPRRGRRRSWDMSTDSSENSIDAVSIFSGTKKNIISKDFRGGSVTNVFGGTDLNLTQADINGNVVIEINQVFGGLKLIIPVHWNVKSEVVCVFGGVDDKRPLSKDTPPTDKILTLKGNCVFGGIDIKSY